ncbi:MAG: beta strand repeat-containing protein, partial [Gemmatimonadales bacterium]
VQPSTVTQGGVIAPPVQVAIQDQFGNLVTTATDLVTIAIGNNPGSASLGGTTAVPATAGVAAFSGLTLNQAGTSYTLTAAATGLAGTTSAAFDVTLVGATPNAWNNSGGGFWSVAANWSLGRVPQASDSVVISLSGTYAVTLDITISVAFLTFGASSGIQTLAMSTRTLTVTNAVTIQSGSVATLSNGTITGAAATANQGTLTLVSTTINTVLANQGVLVIHGSSAINGSFTAAGSSTLRVEGTGAQGIGALTVASGFTNNGLIELTNNSVNQPATLTVTSGTLANAATINVLAGGGARTLAAQLDNQASGTLTLSQALTLSRLDATHTNSGMINVTGADWTLSQSGLTPSFTNTGTITIGATRTWSITNGTVHFSAGTVGGAGTLVLNNLTANFATGFSNTTTTLGVNSATLNGPGTLTNVAGQTLTLTSSTIGATMPLVNQGVLVIHGSSAINGSFTAAGSSTLRVEGTGAQGIGALTVAGGFTNDGLIELTNNSVNQPATLTVTSGTLANAAAINVLAGGGARTLAAQLDNQASGTLMLSQALTLSRLDATHTNAGLIQLTGGDLTVVLSGFRPAIDNKSTGVIDVGINKLVINNQSTGAFTNAGGGILRGSGTIDIGTASFITNGTTIVGTSPGILNWVGTYTQGPDPSVFQVEIGGDPLKPGMDFDQFRADGVALQGGTLNVTQIGLVSKQTYVIIQLPVGKTFNGDFQVKNLPALCNAAVSGTQYLVFCP